MLTTDKIRSRMAQFSPAEKQVAQWLLDQPAGFARMAIADIAQACAVSEPTVVRFCRRIGFSGLKELKLNLLTDQPRAERYLHNSVEEGDTPQEVAVKVVDHAIAALSQVRQACTQSPLLAAAQKLSSARQTIFVGTGASGVVAQDAQHKFFRLGHPCSSARDIKTIVQHCAIARSEDVFVVISNSGDWDALVEAVQVAVKRQAFVVAVTQSETPLARASDVLLACDTGEDTSVYTPMTSRLAHLAMLDALQVVTAMFGGEMARDNLADSKASLAQLYS